MSCLISKPTEKCLNIAASQFSALNIYLKLNSPFKADY